MIFVTVGTHYDPFDRLLQGLAALPAEELVVQHGPGAAPPGVRYAAPWMTFPEMWANFREADAVITHAGVGSILLATQAGHVPIVVPRLKRHAEHVDDHQVELIEELGRTGKVTVVWDVEDLPEAVAATPRRADALVRGTGPLHDAVRTALGGRAGVRRGQLAGQRRFLQRAG